MKVDLYLDQEFGGMSHTAIFTHKSGVLAVVVPEGIDVVVERAFASEEDSNEKLFSTLDSKTASSHRKDDGVCEGEKEGVGRIGGVGERKDEGDEGEERGRNLDLCSVQFPCSDGEDWQADKVMVDAFIIAYGEAAVRTAFPRAKMWLLAHPERRKTQKGMLRFLNRWLSTPSTPGYVHNKNSLNRDVRTTTKIVKGRPTVEGW